MYGWEDVRPSITIHHHVMLVLLVLCSIDDDSWSEKADPTTGFVFHVDSPTKPSRPASQQSASGEPHPLSISHSSYSLSSTHSVPDVVPPSPTTPVNTSVGFSSRWKANVFSCMWLDIDHVMMTVLLKDWADCDYQYWQKITPIMIVIRISQAVSCHWLFFPSMPGFPRVCGWIPTVKKKKRERRRRRGRWKEKMSVHVYQQMMSF